MANIVSITPLPTWTIREFGSASKLNSQVVGKLNSLISNQILVNTGLSELLQGATGGSEQAKIPFVRSAAPAGWTRDTDFLTDHLLRTTDGTTVPPGASPTVMGGVHGGSWTITGLTSTVSGDHTHDMSHTHTMGNHTHTVASHTHGMDHTHVLGPHTHTVDATGLVTSGGNQGETRAISSDSSSNSGVTLQIHRHTADHTHTLEATNSPVTSGGSNVANTSSVADTTSTPSTNSTGDTSSVNSSSDGNHSHTISQDGTWRVHYTNVLMCKKD